MVRSAFVPQLQIFVFTDKSPNPSFDPFMYGSDNPDCKRVDYLGELDPARSTSSKWKKAALVTAGAALCFGGAFVMYEGWNAPVSAAVAGSAPALVEMNLESAAVSTDQTNLMSGQPILLRVKGKANLCADDGGGDSKSFTNQPCNPSNPNQLFIYDSTTSQFKSAKKTNMCMDSSSALITKLRLGKCDKKTDNQGFAYDPSTLQISLLGTKNSCVSDGGGDEAGDSDYTATSCSVKNTANMRFEILSQATLAAEQKAILDAVNGGAKFILRIAGKAGLCASGTGTTKVSTSFVPAVCDKQSKDQLFSYDATTKQVRSAEKQGLCLDDGGAKKVKVDLRLAECSATSVDQTFTYDEATLMVSQPNKAKLCVDDGTSFWFKAPRLILKECDAYTKDQHFEFVLQTDPVTAATSTASAATPATASPAPETTNAPATASSMITASTTTTTAATPAPAIADTPVTISTSPVAVDTTKTSSSEVSTTSTQQAPATAVYETPATTTITLSQPEIQAGVNQQESTTAPPSSQSTAISGISSMTENTQTIMESTGLMMPQQTQMTTTTGVVETSTMNGMTTTSMTEPGTTMSKAGEMIDTASPMLTENEMMTMSTMSKAGDVMTTPAMEPGMTAPSVNEMTTTSMTEPGTTMSWTGETTTTSVMKPGTSQIAKDTEVMTTSMMIPGITTADAAEMMAKGLSTSPPVTSVIRDIDTSLTDIAGQDWNLLAPSESTLARVDTDNEPIIPVANIFQYLQSMKDRADQEHQALMYRYTRTFECATAGLQTLVKDAVTTEEYKLLVRWMYQHCAVGNTNTETPDMPSLPNNAKPDIQRQFMTKLDFYYEIKKYFAEMSEKLNGEVAANRLRSEETKNLEEKMLDCVDEASDRFSFQGNSEAYATTEHLKAAIAWVEDSCMKP